jgi:hypothetical protein
VSPRSVPKELGGAIDPGGYAGSWGLLTTGWLFCEPAEPQVEGDVVRLPGCMETSFEAAGAPVPARTSQFLLKVLELDADRGLKGHGSE